MLQVTLMMLCVPDLRHLMDGFVLQIKDGTQYKKYENGVFHPEHVQDSARQPLPGQVGHCDYSPECSPEGSDQVCRHIWSPTRIWRNNSACLGSNKDIQRRTSSPEQVVRGHFSLIRVYMPCRCASHHCCGGRCCC